MKEWILSRVNPVRRRLPMPLVRPVIATRTRLGIRRPALMAAARKEMEWLAGEVPGSDIEDLARKHVGWYMRRAEMRHHPDTVSAQRIIGLEHLEQARDAQALGDRAASRMMDIRLT